MLVVGAKDESTLTVDIKKTLKKTRLRNQDKGPSILSYMQHFVQLVRKVQRADLIQALIEKTHGQPVDALALLQQTPFGLIPAAIRWAIFTSVASLPHLAQQNLERIAERVTLLCDEYGVLAINEQINHHAGDTEFLSSSADKYSRALYLYLSQAFPIDGSVAEKRFDRAETRQDMLRQGQNDQYSSHYLGPQGIEPKLNEDINDLFCEQLAELFPGVKAEEIVLETFLRREGNDSTQPIALYTLKAMFNGSKLCFQKIIDNEVVEHDEAVITHVEYAWQPAKGTLSVYCEDKEIRPELANLFRDTILDSHAGMSSMPLREFNLLGFTTPAILERIQKDRIEGIESIAIQDIVVSKPHVHQIYVRGQVINRLVASDLRIRRHRFDQRNIYEIAQEDNKINDLRAYEILKVKLAVRIASRRHRSAHNVSFEITAPNGINDLSKAEEDNELILNQLEKLGCTCLY